MLTKAGLTRALVCLLLAFQITSAYRIDFALRQDDGASSSITATGDSKPESTQTEQTTAHNSDESSSVKETDAPKTTASGKKGNDNTSTDTATATATASVAISTNGTLNDDIFVNATVPAGELPLTPVLTPGWGVAGAVMLLTGGVYALIGIKNRYVHTFFSTAFSAALGIAVLIIYVMSLPVSDALQGGYVAAIILSGCALGAASCFFKELTEGLGCALGGFCVSMWLMTLVDGGILKDTAPRAIFISCFTAVGFAFYFSHYTRDWALITMISFAGATVITLGIDCFSRAGLKEFWAYVWDLNHNLFPLGANTYPVTKGIRVETAAIIILFFVGIISQVKLWRVVREKKKQHAEARAQHQRDLEQEEANVGRQIEEANSRERRQWERIYGDGEAGSTTVSESASEKKLRESYNDEGKLPSDPQTYEMADMSESDRGQQQAEPIEQDADGTVTVRVAADDGPETSPFTDDGTDDATRIRSVRTSATQSVSMPAEKKRLSQEQANVPEPPEVVALPFTVPEAEEREDNQPSQRSSVATFAADDEGGVPTATHRQSLARHLSSGSSKLLRSLSQRSSKSKRNSQVHSQAPGESLEELVIPTGNRADDESSLAATLDRQSMISDRRSEIGDLPSIQIDAQLSQDCDDIAQTGGDKDDADVRPLSTATLNQLSNRDNAPGTTSGNSEDQKASQQDTPDKAKSTMSAVSGRASLTQQHLPHTLSRVALSYRTNEWAKHLGYADTPEPEDISVAQMPKKQTRDSMERVAPLNVNELQQGIADGTPPPAIVRSDSRTSMASLNHVMPKRDSKQKLSNSPSPDNKDVQQFQPPAMLNAVRSSSSMALRRNSPQFTPIAEESGSSPTPDDQGRGAVPGIVSYSNPQTLLGQREVFLRNKSTGNLLATTPEPYTLPQQPYVAAQRPPSDAGSLHNYPMYAAAFAADPDDVPLSQRKEYMHRQHSLSALSGANMLGGTPPMASSPDLNGGIPFNSHQPQRSSTLPTPAAREAQLASFRSSVQQELRAGNTMMTPSGRETPFASTNNLLTGREAEVKRNIETQRSMMLNQKEAEAQRREFTRREKEFADKVFDERMRSGELIDAHREVMRRMQLNARDK